ncbi:ATP-binding protein [Paludibacterium paludis]|uniref:ATPase AAA n=1 Tax=Paludibacterium paludis TaxID=1225769 RepID=A0A918P6P7_9NEIS|nr:ATP-binding protein [Paludibacterium paludis]GGY27165.1 ATPase AAA [Paludibacterium paludis]
MDPRLQAFLERAESLMARLEAMLPPVPAAIDWAATAFVWRRGTLEAIDQPHVVDAERLCAVEAQRRQLFDNTRQFLKGKPANHVLLSGARGTGKSSLVKSLLPAFADKGLRLIELDKSDLGALPDIAARVADRPERFIVFCDDLAFDEEDDAFKALKVILDGGLRRRAANLLVCATSNRRHLLPEYHADNKVRLEGGELHPSEAVESKVSLSDRFGLWLSFYPFDQDAYLAAAASWLDAFGLDFDDSARRAALLWSQTRGGRSGRVAWQFACDWAGKTPKQRKASLHFHD